MAGLDKNGMLSDSKIICKRFTQIEHGSLEAVHAIVVHQTDSGTAQSAFTAYTKGGNGAHFLIDKNGSVYQTASLRRRCYHVGKLIRSRCLEISGKSCPDGAIAKAATMGWTSRIKQIDQIERKKSYPDRYPVNSDSIGIELVGMHVDEKTYEPLTLAQNNSLLWLIDLLYKEFKLTSGDVFRHPDVSYKNPGEARSATWQ
jgi:N-acetyl-anhydromuramyl-L-alanine amidase AmpD